MSRLRLPIPRKCCLLYASLVAGFAFTAATLTADTDAPMHTIIGWEFERDSDLLGWTPNSHTAEVAVRAERLQGKVTGHDPFLVSPLFELPATPFQEVHMRLKCSHAGQGDLFFSNTTNPPHDGFSARKLCSYRVTAPGEWQVVKLKPYWQGENRIIHVRLDVPQCDSFAVDWIRIVQPGDGAAPTDQTRWTCLDGIPSGWRRIDDGTLQSPLLSVDADAMSWLRLELATPTESRVAIRWASDSVSGLRSMAMFTAGDGRRHTYSMDLGSDPSWIGRILLLGLRITTRDVQPCELRSLALASDRHPDPDVRVLYFGRENAVNRVGAPCRFMLRLLNQGGTETTCENAALTLKGAARLIDEPLILREPVTLEPDVPHTAYIGVLPTTPGMVEADLRLSGRGVPNTIQTTLPIEVAARPTTTRDTDYIPEPEPAQTDYTIGSFYYPGFGTDRQWRQLERSAPWAKPVLGYYDEGLTECVDWQIKWAVEHGVKFFLVDWYWVSGRKRYLHYLDAFAKSRFRAYFKWAVMWANHNPPNTHSEADWRDVTRYWIDHYFGMDEYLRLDGKPAVAIWSPANIRRDMGGSEQTAKLLTLSQSMARDAGLPGITFIAMNSARADTQRVEGYRHQTSYHWWHDSRERAPDGQYFPFSLVVDRSRDGWDERERRLEDSGIGFIPNADTGWDARPRHGTRTMVIHDRTPAEFERVLREAKAWLDERQEKMLILGPWNEWTEGSYIEPCTEFGFGMLQAIHNVFCAGNLPVGIAPTDLGIGPYDFPLHDVTVKHPEWLFDGAEDSEGWVPMMNLKEVQVRDGAMCAVSTHHDPAFLSPNIELRARDYTHATVRVRIEPAPQANQKLLLFWATTAAPIHSRAYVQTPLCEDSEMHTYILDLQQHRRWRGLITRLRLDPCMSADKTITVDEVKLLRHP